MASIKPAAKDTVQSTIENFISPPVKVYSPKQTLAAQQSLWHKLNDWCTKNGWLCYKGDEALATNGRPSLLVFKKQGQGLAVWIKAPGCLNQSNINQEKQIRKMNDMFNICVVDDFEQAKRDINFYFNKTGIQ